MRSSRCLAAASIVAVAIAAPSFDVAAQSFLQILFGFGAQSQRPSPQPPAYQSPPVRNFGRAPIASAPRVSRPDQSTEDEGGTRRGGHYRTVCVRLCDGYYFPISNVARRQDFYRDAKACSARCGEQGKLFYQSSSDQDMSELVDLQGRNYNKLSTAFIYRKKLVDGCSCRPMPWSEAEAARHRQYALAEEAEKAEQLRIAALASAKPSAKPVSKNKGSLVQTASVVEPVAAVSKPPSVTGVGAPPPDPEGVDEPADGESDAGSVATPVITTPPVVEPPPTERPRNWREPRDQREVREPRPQRASRNQAPARASAPAQKPSSGFGGFGGGAPKYTWPGDAPQRPR